MPPSLLAALFSLIPGLQQALTRQQSGSLSRNFGEDLGLVNPRNPPGFSPASQVNVNLNPNNPVHRILGLNPDNPNQPFNLGQQDINQLGPQNLRRTGHPLSSEGFNTFRFDAPEGFDRSTLAGIGVNSPGGFTQAPTAPTRTQASFAPQNTVQPLQLQDDFSDVFGARTPQRTNKTPGAFPGFARTSFR